MNQTNTGPASIPNFDAELGLFDAGYLWNTGDRDAFCTGTLRPYDRRTGGAR